MHDIDRLNILIKEAECILVLTGAGISKESGIPTFRGKDGWYKQHSPEELATFSAFHKNPWLVWEWYNLRRKIILSAKPNIAHFKIAEIEKHKPCFLLVTQNVDSLHRKAGSKKIIELHGNIFRTKCIKCGKVYEEDYIIFNEEELPPRCPNCNGLLRPDVVWFGESLNEKDLNVAMSFAKKADLALVIGTSGVVYPAAMLPQITKLHGGRVAEINPQDTPITGISDISIKASATVALEKIKIV